MNAKEVLTELTRLDIHITIKGDSLSVIPPKGHSIAPELLEQLKTNKKEVIDLLSANVYHEPPPLTLVPRDKAIPLSFAQQRLWFINQYEEGKDISYNAPGALRLEGTLNITALQNALNSIIQRHESLRTTFRVIDYEAKQCIADKLILEVPVIDVTEAEVKNYVRENASQIFDLEKGPLITVSILRLSEKNYILLINMHYIIIDNWSMGIFNRELTTFYTAYSKGENLTLPSLPMQYADFAVWQRHWLQRDVLDQQVSYWKKQLADAPALLELPTDKSRPAKQSCQGSHCSFVFTKILSQQLKKLCSSEDTTLSTVLLSAFIIFLSRYSRQIDICVGIPIANRKHSELEGLIGLFTNPLVIRNKVDRNKSFKFFLQQVKSTSLDAYSHQDIPFEHLIKALGLKRSLSYSSLFQVMFSLQDVSYEDITLPGLIISSVKSERYTSKFDLTISMTESDKGIAGEFEYRTDLFDLSTINNLFNHYKILLKSIVTNTNQIISNLPLLGEVEHKKVLYDWNKTYVSYPQGKCIHQLFEEQVEITPNTIAVVYENNQQLTYRTLDQKSNQVAHYLIERGVRLESIVGLCMERSLEMIICMLGILKAGGAYLPIDPEYPLQRIDHMISDSGAVLLLADKKSFNNTISHLNIPCFCLEKNWGMIINYSYINPAISVFPENLVYIIYTSGSTGKPKGVMVSHNNLLQLCYWHNQSFSVTHLSKATQLAGIGFDAMAWEVWPYLMAGAQLVLVQPELVLVIQQFIKWLYDQEITHCFVPTPMVKKLVTEHWPKKNRLEFLLTGGEKLYQLPSKDLQYKLINNYGLTEATVVTTSGAVSSKKMSPLSIGRPISNTMVYVLDTELNPVPIGVSGELYIGGEGLARGYLNKADLTAERFTPNPFSCTPGERLYQSGDLVRHLPDGNVDFIGRIDNQVKIRGFRIELEEIENVLKRQAGVSNALVLTFSRDSNDTAPSQYIVAYVIPKPEIQLNQGQLRIALKAVLPNYMVPSFFIALDQFPLTANGKIDKKALPTPDIHVEQELVKVWSDFLGIPPSKISIYDNFFDLGGNSIMIISLKKSLEELVGKKIPITSLFKYPSISALSTFLKGIPEKSKNIKNDFVKVNIRSIKFRKMVKKNS